MGKAKVTLFTVAYVHEINKDNGTLSMATVGTRYGEADARRLFHQAFPSGTLVWIKKGNHPISR